MIRSLLVANRGEIARRILRTARRLGIRTIAVHSDADRGLPFVREADVAVRIGRSLPAETYLRGDLILAAAQETGAEAIHPGYGFLSENADFADAVEAAGLIWVGAPPAAIRAMGLKDAAKRVMEAAGVPTTPGYLGDDQSDGRLAAEADRIGWPVLIKAVAGGGGKGMRRVDSAADFADALASCRREAASAFGDDRVLLERYILNPRHIEVQIFGDRQGRVVHLFERDCSLQRRHQKVVEEAPAPGMDEATRAALCAAAVRAAQAVDYVGAGTVEFIADGSGPLRADRIWFMEMNTRLQVEHPVTEAITGQDLVEWQLRVASGEPLPCRQEDLRINGWAVEARLYAEDPARDFLPSVGRIEALGWPDPRHVRVDSGVEQGDAVTPFYDPMVAKLIAHAPGRQEAIDTLAGSLDELLLWPLRTNASFLARTLRQPDFVAGAVDTGLLGRHRDGLVTDPPAPSALLARTVREWPMGDDPGDGVWHRLPGFRVNADPAETTWLYVDGRAVTVDRAWSTDPSGAAGSTRIIGPDAVLLCRKGTTYLVSLSPPEGTQANGAGDGAVVAPMPGRIVSVEVTQGTVVEAGERLVVMEAMKMEQALIAPFAGTVAALPAEVGGTVAEGMLLARVVPFTA
jgi:3-methylcrotonyl-CoA carboxylase alpha subunit